MPPLLYLNSSRLAPLAKYIQGCDDIGKKMGRPTVDPKNHVARLRLSENEKQKLDECCRLTGMNITEVLKLGIDKVYEEYSQK